MEQLTLEAPPTAKPRPRLRGPVAVLTLLAVAQFIDILDVTIVNVALPRIQRDLHFSGNNLQWVISIYVLFYGGFLLLGGRLADTWGRRRVFMIGLTLFGSASLAAGLAPDAGALIVVRALQGLGGSLMAPAALSLLTVAFPAGRQRDVALGIWGGLAGLGGTLGVVIGGVLVDSLSWRWIFYVNVPLIAVILVLAPLVLSESRAPQREGRVDLAGPFLATTGLLSLVLGVIQTDTLGWRSGEVVALLATAATLLSTFVLVELRRPHPMLPLAIFRSRGLSLGSVMLALNGGAILSVFFLNSTFLQLVRGEDALHAGLDFLPMGAGAILGAVVAGQVVTRVGTRPVQLVGAALTSLGLYWLLSAGATTSYPSTLLVGFALFGAGITTLGVPTQIGAVADVAHHNAGVSSGVMSAAYQIGGAIGLAVITTLTTARVTHLTLGGEPLARAMTGGYHLGITVALGLALANGAIALASPSVRPTTEMVRSAGA